MVYLSSSLMSKLSKFTYKTSALFLCDMQEKFRPNVHAFKQIVEVSSRMLAAAKILQMPIIVTEQNPKALGKTVDELDVIGLPIFPKMQFSMLIPEVKNHLSTLPKVNSILLCGIEAHACILQTALDLRENDYDVHIISDAISSRNNIDRLFAIESMRESGCHVTTCEAAILNLIKSAEHPHFKQLQKIIFQLSPDSGLIL